MLDTTCSEVVWRVLATHSIRQFPIHFPSRASRCAITFQRDSTNDFFLNWQTINIFTIKENTCFQNTNITSEYRAVCCGYLVKYFYRVRRSFTVHIKMVYRCYCKVMFLFFCRLYWPQRVNKCDKTLEILFSSRSEWTDCCYVELLSFQCVFPTGRNDNKLIKFSTFLQ